MLDSSGQLAEFSRDYRHRVRDIQRTGPLPNMLPSIAECDDMIRHQLRIQDVLGRLREMLVSQHDAAVNRHAQERVFKGPADFEMEDPSLGLEEVKPNGVMTSEARKRRGVSGPSHSQPRPTRAPSRRGEGRGTDMMTEGCTSRSVS